MPFVLAKKQINYTILLISALALNGCVTSPSTDVDSDTALSEEIKNHVYGYLSKDANGAYEFSDFAISEDNIQYGLPWVRLTDSRPMWNTRTPSACGESATRQPSYCSEGNEDLFIEVEVDTSQLGKTAAVGVFTMGLSLIAGLPNEPVFQEDDFLDAVDEASKRIPNFSKKIRKIDQPQSVDGSEAYERYLNQAKPNVKYKVWNRLPSLQSGLNFLDEMGKDYVASFPQITLKTVSFLESQTGISMKSRFESLEEILEILSAPEESRFAYGAECNFRNSILTMDFKCPDGTPSVVDVVVVDFFVNSAQIMNPVIPPIKEMSNNKLTLTHFPAKERPWIIANETSLPIQLRSMAYSYHRRDAAIDLSGLGIVEPGESIAFNLDRWVYRRLNQPVAFNDESADKRLKWSIRVNYKPMGLMTETASFSGTDSIQEIAEYTAVVHSLNSPIGPTLTERVNQRY